MRTIIDSHEIARTRLLLVVLFVLGSMAACARQRPQQAPIGEVHSTWDGYRRTLTVEEAKSRVSSFCKKVGADETLDDLVVRCRGDNDRFGLTDSGRQAKLWLKRVEFCAPLEGETNCLLVMFTPENVTDVLLVYRLNLGTGELVKFLYHQ
jgi:hypothetical protein